ncbi:conserved hypothetical protein [Pediculus humanus corporis]|uniref:IRS-type PTB domain-containing protein n=1 Tax=Pediculus humanus subsp. corporis TaxID=121224 RepID=E0VNA0_PEDHC|nr:uncharacterized protein Phum_PHUM332130 [Pediculus humanus corporis]EEB14856.1 conserved hypothetical protein [Pediculus humanus corporis]
MERNITDSRDRYKQGQTKASLSLQHFLGVETGFTLDKESNTIAIICQDVTVVLAFDTRERLIQWQVKISCNLGEDQQFLVLVSQAPSKAKISTGPARLHVQELKFSMTSGVPPRLIGFWEIGHLRRYGVVEGRFCFEGGSRCGKGEGLYVVVTDQGAEITRTLQMAAQGKLTSRRRQVVRKTSVTDSPRKLLHSRQENRVPDNVNDNHNDFNDGDLHNQAEQNGSPYWSIESRPTDLDSNYGCGDTASVHMHQDNAWPHSNEKGLPPSLERCVSCISKLGAPTLSRSSTANTSTLFNPAWTMEPIPVCSHQNPVWASGSDRASVSSHGTGSSGNSEYSVARHFCEKQIDNRNTTQICPPLPPKVINSAVSQTSSTCNCTPPNRPPKPVKEALNTMSPSRKKIKKPPMPLPEKPKPENESPGPYENYDTPKNISNICDKQPLHDPSNRLSMSPTPCEHYDTPRNIKEIMSANEVNNYGNYDIPPPAKTIRKPCGCVVTFARQATDSDKKSECPCQRVLCWAENWMILPYCRRGHGIDNNSVPIHKVKLSGEGKMPVVNPSGELAIYATIDKAKKLNRKLVDEEESSNKQKMNYENIIIPNKECDEKISTNYENIEFAQSLVFYENSKDLIHKIGISQEELEKLSENVEKESEVTFSLNNGVKVCNKCGHACETNPDKKDDKPPTTKINVEQENYLVMNSFKEENNAFEKQKPVQSNFPGYLPMFPGNKAELIKLLGDRGFPVEKSASVTSLPIIQKGKKRSESEVRVPGSAMMIAPSGNLHTRRIIDVDDDRKKLVTRRRSSSADSSRYLEDYDETESRCSSLSSPCKIPNAKLKATSNSLTSLPYQSPKKELNDKNKDGTDVAEEDLCERTIIENGIANEEDCSSSGSLQTLVHESLKEGATSNAVYIRRSSSVPCKAGNNRDSSSSNDSGVSTGSLKQRGDFEFELPLTTAMSTKRHQTVAQKHLGNGCLHASLPRRSKSSDPLRELSFQFQMTKIPAKSSSAEAEVPVCTTKKVPYMDSRSTSSGTSDMSDYIETLSLSSHSSSDAPDSFPRIAATTLRPRSGNEYHKIDRSILNGEFVKKGHYANIGPLPEKAESPSPGYMSSSPAHEVQYTDF